MAKTFEEEDRMCRNYKLMIYTIKKYPMKYKKIVNILRLYRSEISVVVKVDRKMSYLWYLLNVPDAIDSLFKIMHKRGVSQLNIIDK